MILEMEEGYVMLPSDQRLAEEEAKLYFTLCLIYFFATQKPIAPHLYLAFRHQFLEQLQLLFLYIHNLLRKDCLCLNLRAQNIFFLLF